MIWYCYWDVELLKLKNIFKLWMCFCYMCWFCRYIIYFNELNNKIVLNVVVKWEIGILFKLDINYSVWWLKYSGKFKMIY